MTDIINLHGGPLTAQQRQALKRIRQDLAKMVMPLNAERTLATAVVGIIDALLPGIDMEDAEDTPQTKAEAI